MIVVLPGLLLGVLLMFAAVDVALHSIAGLVGLAIAMVGLWSALSWVRRQLVIERRRSRVRR